MKQTEIIPSILVNSFEEFDKKIRVVESHVKWVQLDIADGNFAPNKTWGDPSQLRDYNTEVLIEVHLMVSEPEKIIDEWLIVRSVTAKGHPMFYLAQNFHPQYPTAPILHVIPPREFSYQILQ